MRKLLKNREFISTNIIGLIPIIVALIIYPRLPDKLPTHFNIYFQADNYGPKWLAVIVIPLLFLVLLNLIWFIYFKYPKKSEIKNNMVLKITLWSIPVLSCIIQYVTISYAMFNFVNVARLIPISVGVLIVLLGNYLPKSRQNFIIGIRTPWSLSSRENWTRTNRFGGKVFIISGIFMILAGFSEHLILLFLLTSIILLLVPFIYSYYIFQRS